VISARLSASLCGCCDDDSSGCVSAVAVFVEGSAVVVLVAGFVGFVNARIQSAKYLHSL